MQCAMCCYPTRSIIGPGAECRAFEKEFAAWCGTSHAVALANGTLALDLALKAWA
jgi:dTDP-4-amino-4,6-dideoxygalactose transaminase